mgnify:CR=1 FL=1
MTRHAHPDAEHSPSESKSLLQAAYRNSLQVAADAGLDSVGLCSVSTGVFGYPKEEAARLVVSVIDRWLGAHPEAGLRIVASKRIHLSPAQAGAFYAEHKERPFYGELVEFMGSEPVVVQVLEGENAILKNREVMGATNPANADAGTIRKEFAESIEANSVHGSDSDKNAGIEIGRAHV